MLYRVHDLIHSLLPVLFTCRISWLSIIVLRQFSCLPLLTRVFSVMKRWWIWSNTLSESSSPSFCYHLFLYAETFFHSRKKSHLVMVYNAFIGCWIQLSILLHFDIKIHKGCWSLFILVIYFNSLGVVPYCLYLILHQGNGNLTKLVVKYSLLFPVS